MCYYLNVHFQGQSVKVPQSAATFVHPPLFLHLSDIFLNYKEINFFFSLYKRQETAKCCTKEN